MPILKIFTCIQQHRIYQLSDTSLYQRLSRTFKRPLCPWTGLWEKNNNNNNETNTDTNAGAHSDQGYLLGKKKVCTPKCPVSYVKKKKIHTQKNKKITKKSASDFSTRQRSTPLLPMQLQEGFLYYTYIYVLVGKPCWSEKVSACSSVSN